MRCQGKSKHKIDSKPQTLPVTLALNRVYYCTFLTLLGSLGSLGLVNPASPYTTASDICHIIATAFQLLLVRKMTRSFHLLTT